MDGSDCTNMSVEAVAVKEECEWWNSAEWWGVSEAARAGLYAGHEVKRELVLGPEVLHQPIPMFTDYETTHTDSGYSHRGSGHYDHTYAKRERSPVAVCVKEEGGKWEVQGDGECFPLRDSFVRLEPTPTQDMCSNMSRTHAKESDVRMKSLKVTAKNYTCPMCHQILTLKSQLTEHLAVHIHMQAGPEQRYTNSDIIEVAEDMNDNLLPIKSRGKYIAVHEKFISWINRNNKTSLSENVLMAYFGEITKKYKPSSLWAIHSMLKTTLQTRHGINIDGYKKLTAYVKKQSHGYIGKKSKILTGDDIEKFIDEAPDDRYLATKAALILGVTGDLRPLELAELTTTDIKQQGDVFIVKIPNADNKTPRPFVVDGKYFKIVKKYRDLRSVNEKDNRFFQRFINGYCTTQVMGKNKIASMPKQIAEYLNLPDASSYTGHSFRRTSAILLADSGADIMARVYKQN